MARKKEFKDVRQLLTENLEKLMNAGICCIRMAAVIPSGVTELT